MDAPASINLDWKRFAVAWPLLDGPQGTAAARNSAAVRPFAQVTDAAAVQRVKAHLAQLDGTME